MTDITATARAFFEACETGKGWGECAQHCTADASFAAQSEALADMSTLEDYTNWMQGLLTILEDGSYTIKGFATDFERNTVLVYGVFTGTHTGTGGPVEPTGKTAQSDYVYAMEFDGDKIRHMTKIWHSGWALAQLGWA